MKRLLFIAMFIALSTSAAYAEKVGTPIPIGIGVAQTSDVALFGQEQIIGAKIAEKLLNVTGVNGTPVRLVYQDTGGDEAGAISAFQNLINQEKVVGIVGPTLSQQAFSADPIANRLRVPVIAPSNTAKGIPQIGEFIGRVSAPVARVAPSAVGQALKQDPGIRRVAVLYARNDAYSSSESETFQEAVKGHRLQLAAVQKFLTTDTDFTTQTKTVMDARVDLVIISGLAADGGNLVRQLRRMGYKGTVVGGNGFNTASIFPVCGKDCDGILVAQAYSPEARNQTNDAFVAEYRSRYKKDPLQFSAQTFAAVQVIVESLRKVEATAKRKIAEMDLSEVRIELNRAIRTGSYITPLGEIGLDQEGEIDQRTFYVARITMDADGKAGKFVIVR